MTSTVIYSVMYSVVIPVYRESRSLIVLLEELRQVLEPLDQPFEIIMIDDGSPDDTWLVLEQQCQHYPFLKAVRLSRNFGKEYALSAGLELAQGAAIIIMDGDLQHPPALIPTMIECWCNTPKLDIVEAVKTQRPEESVINRIGAKLFYSLLFKTSGYDLRGASDYKLLDRKALNAWRQMGEHNLFFRGMSAWLGFNRMQIPFEVPNRSSGGTRWSIKNLTKLAITGVTSFSSLPLHFVTLSGGAFLIVATLFIIQTLWLKLTGQAVDGFSTVIILLLVIGSLLMISLGIIGIYLARIYDEVKHRPRYLIAETLNLSHAQQHQTFRGSTIDPPTDLGRSHISIGQSH
jgi:polyisoprenyl-phosphate glycosyltransferase